MIRIGGGLALDPQEIGSQGNAILGIRDSGKTYTATLLAEQLMLAKVPFIAFDPIGVWRFLRVPGKGKGFPVVVAGGEAGDLPLNPATAPAIVEAAMVNGVSLVIDLFHMGLSKAQWRQIVRDCVRLLLHRNREHGLRHVFLEEAAEFAPQRVLDGEVYAEIEKLARMGGNSRLGYTLINQRAQEVNKAVLELCDNLFLHRQKGRNALDAIGKWLDIAGTTENQVVKTLPTLPQGECWAWLSGSDTPVLFKVPEKRSFHPDRRAMAGDMKAAAPAVPVDKFVAQLAATLPKLEEERLAADPKALRARVAELERQLTAKPAADPAIARELGRHQAMFRRLKTECIKAMNALSNATEAMTKADAAFDQVHRIVEDGPEAASVGVVADLVVEKLKRRSARPLIFDESDGYQKSEGAVIDTLATGRVGPSVIPAPQPPKRDMDANGVQVPSGCGKPLAALAAASPAGMTEAQWGTAAGYKIKGGTWGEYKRRLMRAGMVAKGPGGQYFATELGAESAGPVELPPPAGPDRARWWAKRIPGTPKMVEVLIAQWPKAVTKGDLAIEMDMTVSGGSFNEYLRRLVRNGIAEVVDGSIRLTEAVMGDAQ